MQVYISIQYQVIREKVFDAVYRLTNPQEQVSLCVLAGRSVGPQPIDYI